MSGVESGQNAEHWSFVPRVQSITLTGGESLLLLLLFALGKQTYVHSHSLFRSTDIIMTFWRCDIESSVCIRLCKCQKIDVSSHVKTNMSLCDR